MKNVCLLIYSLRSGGAERVISQWSQLLSHDYNVFMTIFDSNGINYPYAGQLVDLKVPSNNKSTLSKFLVVLKRARKLREFVERNNIDIVISFCNECNLVNTISRHRAKKICSIRNAVDVDANAFVKYVIKSSNNTIVVQTHALKESIENRFGKYLQEKIKVFGNPFDTERIKNLSAEPLSDNDKALFQDTLAIVSVASFKKPKNHPGLIRSFELVCQKKDNVKLFLVGADNGQLLNIRKMAQRSAFSDRIIFVGEKKNPFPYLKSASVFALPSLNEGIPNALAEALICGCPVVATNCPTGPRELLCNETSMIDVIEGFEEVDYGVLTAPFPNKYDCFDQTYSTADQTFADALLYTLDKEINTRLREKASIGASKFDLEEYKNNLKKMVDAELSKT